MDALRFSAGSLLCITLIALALLADPAALHGRETTPPARTFIYLPLVSTESSVPFSVASFERDEAGWASYSQIGQRLIRPAAELAVPPHSGEWAVRLGHANDEASLISRAFTIEGNRTCLTYWAWVDSRDVCNVDFGGVGVNGKWTSDVHSLCAGTATRGWTQRRVNLSGYLTETDSLVLNFAARTDYSEPSTLYVDNFAFRPTDECTTESTEPPTGTVFAGTSTLVGQPIVLGE